MVRYSLNLSYALLLKDILKNFSNLFAIPGFETPQKDVVDLDDLKQKIWCLEALFKERLEARDYSFNMEQTSEALSFVECFFSALKNSGKYFELKKSPVFKQQIELLVLLKNNLESYTEQFQNAH